MMMISIQVCRSKNEDSILDRRIPWIAVYQFEDSQFEDSHSAFEFADRSLKISTFTVCSFSLKFGIWKISAFAVCRFEDGSLKTEVLRFSTFAVSSLKTHFQISHFRSFNFEVSTLKFQISHFQSFFSSVPFISFRFLSFLGRRPFPSAAGQATEVPHVCVLNAVHNCDDRRD